MKTKRHYCRLCGRLTTGGKWSPFFCPDCDQKRMEHLTKQFDEIGKVVAEKKAKEARG